LDKDIASFLKFLDKRVGPTNYTLFLTADHAAVQVPSYLQHLKIPAGYINKDSLNQYIQGIVKHTFKADSLIENISNYQIFLNHLKIKKLGLNSNNVAQTIADEIINFKGIYKSVTALTLKTSNLNTGILHNLQFDYSQRLTFSTGVALSGLRNLTKRVNHVLKSLL